MEFDPSALPPNHRYKLLASPRPPAVWSVRPGWARDGLVDAGMHVDLDGLDALGKISGSGFYRTTDRFDLVRGRAALSLPDPISSKT